jgi:hypothetical protein
MGKKCIYENCKRYAIYNYADQKKLLYCFEHKKEKMVDIIHKKCIEPGCIKNPNFNYENEKQPLYCKKHKKDNMIDIIHKRCIEPDCIIQPIFNLENEKQPLYCKKHKKDNMVNIIHKRCIGPECNKRPTFNLENEKQPLYCKKHKKEDMVDIINKSCIEPDCIKTPNFNYENEKKRLYCKTHKKEGMIDIVSRRCKNNCGTIVSRQKYNGYCLFCFIHLFPDEPVTRNYKTKEKHISDNIKENYKGYIWVCDKSISGGCSRRRPDMFLELDNQCIIIEIDENQHTDYDCTCENKRIMELSKDVGHKPIVFIRFNPDDYLDGEKNITSCWGNGKDGICRIKKNKVKEWNNRMNTLKEQINYWIKPENTTNKTIEIIQLFYDK